MLTLFKPWRTGKDLKREKYSWDETCMAHKFTEHQVQLMDNFNVRYECNDARDDFSTQQKKGQSEMFPQWMTTEIIDEIDDFNINGHGDDFGDDEGDNEDYGVNKYSTLGPRGTLSKAQMDDTENSVKGAGWLDDSPNGLHQVDKKPLKPEISQTSAKWKASVLGKRQEVIAERAKHIQSTSGTHKLNSQFR
jgi:hypothetical protein